MALDPYYYQKLKQDESGNLIPDPEVANSEAKFRITGFAETAGYKLIFWESGEGDEVIAGEYLYRGRTPIAMSGGQLPLYTKGDRFRKKDLYYESIDVAANSFDDTIGKYGVSALAAQELRNPANTFYFS